MRFTRKRAKITCYTRSIFFERLRDEISKEIQKGTDLTPYLSAEFNILKREYEIKLVLPSRPNLFDTGGSD